MRDNSIRRYLFICLLLPISAYAAIQQDQKNQVLELCYNHPDLEFYNIYIKSLQKLSITSQQDKNELFEFILKNCQKNNSNLHFECEQSPAEPTITNPVTSEIEMVNRVAAQLPNDHTPTIEDLREEYAYGRPNLTTLPIAEQNQIIHEFEAGLARLGEEERNVQSTPEHPAYHESKKLFHIALAKTSAFFHEMCVIDRGDQTWPAQCLNFAYSSASMLKNYSGIITVNPPLGLSLLGANFVMDLLVRHGLVQWMTKDKLDRYFSKDTIENIAKTIYVLSKVSKCYFDPAGQVCGLASAKSLALMTKWWPNDAFKGSKHIKDLLINLAYIVGQEAGHYGAQIFEANHNYYEEWKNDHPQNSDLACNGTEANCNKSYTDTITIKAHNAYSNLHDNPSFVGRMYSNQIAGVEDQFNHFGVRGFALEVVVNDKGEAMMAHENLLFQYDNLVTHLSRYKKLLDENPREVINLSFETYSSSSAGDLIPTAIEASGLGKYVSRDYSDFNLPLGRLIEKNVRVLCDIDFQDTLVQNNPFGYVFMAPYYNTSDYLNGGGIIDTNFLAMSLNQLTTTPNGRTDPHIFRGHVSVQTEHITQFTDPAIASEVNKSTYDHLRSTLLKNHAQGGNVKVDHVHTLPKSVFNSIMDANL